MKEAGLLVALSLFFKPICIMKSTTSRILLLFFLLQFLPSCKPEKPDVYSIEYHFPDESLRKNLMASIITYIYKAPPGASLEMRFDEAHKDYYLSEVKNFEMLKYHIAEDGYHYFYILRPARNVHNHKRGVGGKFKYNEDGSLSHFEEVWVTPMVEEEKIKNWAAYFFPDFIQTGRVDNYLPNTSMVEFPNDRAKYDNAKYEWRYDILEN
jgi:hypothetical protein